MPIHVRFLSRDPVHGDVPAGHVDEDRLFSRPHWRGNPGPTHTQFIIDWLWWADDGEPRKQGWLCYFLANNRDLHLESAADEREEWKLYFDYVSYVQTRTPTEVVEWFERHGIPLPRKLQRTNKRTKSPKADLTNRKTAILKILGKLKMNQGLMAKEILDKLPANPPRPAESTLRKYDLSPMVKSGHVINRRGVGYSLPPKRRD
jgi:hypothetical protein